MPQEQPAEDKSNKKMPGLTVDISPQSQTSGARSSNSPSASPVHPPYSPITPTLQPVRLATSSNSSRDVAPGSSTSQQQTTYTHSQPRQTAIPQPAPLPITLDENPDALALKSAISILQLQARNARADIQTLQHIKERAIEDPEGFTKAVVSGEVKGKSDSLFAPSQDDDEDDDEEEEEEQQTNPAKTSKDGKKWPRLPTPQNVVRCPPINWHQYAVVGESLDKLHADQQARPTEGMPQKVGPDGQLSSGGDGQRRQADLGLAAPYQHGRDKIEKVGIKKGGKR